MKIDPPLLKIEMRSENVHPGEPVMIRVHVTERWAEDVEDQEVAAAAEGLDVHEFTDSNGRATFMFHAPEGRGGELDVHLRLIPSSGVEFLQEPQEAVVKIPVLRD